MPFSEAIRELPRAAEASVAYHNPRADEWVETDRFNAIVEPSRLREQARGDRDVEPLFHVLSDSYTILNPVDVYGPLVDVLDRSNEADLATTLLHEYAHARLHFDVDDRDERARYELKAECVACVVGRHFRLYTSNSVFNLAAWADDNWSLTQCRLEGINEAPENSSSRSSAE